MCVIWGGLNPPSAAYLLLPVLARHCTSPLRLPCLSSALNLGSNPAALVLCGCRGGGPSSTARRPRRRFKRSRLQERLVKHRESSNPVQTTRPAACRAPGTPRPGWGSGGTPGALPRCRYRSPGS